MPYPVALIGILLVLSYNTLAQAQCDPVNATGNPSDSVCATLHIFTDISYTLITSSLQVLDDSWIFAGVISDTNLQLYDCWATAELNNDPVYHIMRQGCFERDTFYKDTRRIGIYKFYGKFLSLMPENTKSFYIQCQATNVCPATSGLCSLVCQNDPPRKYLLTSTKIEVEESKDTETLTVDLVIVLIVIGVCFLVILLLVVIILLCKRLKKRRKRKQNGNATPILYSTTPITENSNGYQERYVETPPQTDNDSFGDVYAKVNRSTDGRVGENSTA